MQPDSSLRVMCQHEETRSCERSCRCSAGTQSRSATILQSRSCHSSSHNLPGLFRTPDKDGPTGHTSHRASSRIAEVRSSVHSLHKRTHRRAVRFQNIDLQHVREFPSIFSHLQPQQHFQESEGGLLICFGCVCRQQLPWPD